MTNHAIFVVGMQHKFQWRKTYAWPAIPLKDFSSKLLKYILLSKSSMYHQTLVVLTAL